MRPWIVALVNLVLGLPGLVPVFMVWYLLVNWPLAAIGWTERDPTENDGVLPGILAFGPFIALGVIVWALINHLLIRKVEFRRKGLWVLAVLASLVPALALSAYIA